MLQQDLQSLAPQAEYQVLAAPEPFYADMAVFLRVRVTNRSARTWPNQGPNPVNLAYHWCDQAGQIVEFEGLRAALPAPLAPGASAELELQVEPPPAPGAYQLALDLVEEGVGWFSQQGAAPLLLAQTVLPPPAHAGLVCIVNGNCMLNDAVGNHVANQLRFFQAQGYRALVLMENIDPRQPAELRAAFVPISLAQLRERQPNIQTRRGIECFQRAELYVFNYSTYYPLAEAIQLIDHGTVLFDYHGVTPPALWSGAGQNDLIRGQKYVELVRYADYGIAHSGFTRDELLATGLIAPERVMQMAYIVPTERFAPASRSLALLRRYGLAEDQPVLLYVGRMAGNKRIEDLIRALAFIRAQLPHAVLLLTGDHTSDAYAAVVARARELASALGVADAVIFTGQVPDAELAAHYQLADVFVTASLHEGFCIPVVEAMACGVPVVGTHATALPETIGDGGLTFQPQNPADLAEKILTILAGRPRRICTAIEETIDVARI